MFGVLALDTSGALGAHATARTGGCKERAHNSDLDVSNNEALAEG